MTSAFTSHLVVPCPGRDHSTVNAVTPPPYSWMHTTDDVRGHEIEHLLISLLAAGCGQRDDLLLDSLDQAEPQLRGYQFESTPYDHRVDLALANCVAKGYDSPGHHRTRLVLESAGVTDWEAFELCGNLVFDALKFGAD